MKKGNRPANRIAVAASGWTLYAFLVGYDTVAGGETGSTDGYFETLATTAPLPMALFTLYCAFSPVVWPVMVGDTEDTRPRGTGERLRALAFHWFTVLLAVTLIGLLAGTSVTSLLADVLGAPATWGLLGASAAYCMLSPFVLPVLGTRERADRATS
ncbi:hypothetical protein [Streptomyces fradiae]|uniref:hypothetical protein n=1 Tax=Streptomyces fradiae TaxID=1906 RepID=UPI0029438E05|nr:hypothetical protein [Streptomyces fradiae]WOI62361.1 hypothetical protein RYQ63_22050 [Streptomyces fradiae]